MAMRLMILGRVNTIKMRLKTHQSHSKTGLMYRRIN
nr:MAG TPA: hypothetical protein [Caudoviricetes sp.]